MSTNKIRESLELSRASWRSLCREDMVDLIDEALAELDKTEQPHVHTVYDAVGGGDVCSGCDQRFVKSEHPAAGLTVEEVMGVVMKVWDWCDGANAGVPKHQQREYFRLNLIADLTAAMNAKTTKP